MLLLRMTDNGPVVIGALILRVLVWFPDLYSSGDMIVF